MSQIKSKILFSLSLLLAGFIGGVSLMKINDNKLNVLIQAYKYLLSDWYEGVEDETINPDFLNLFLNSVVDDRHTYYTSTIRNIDDSYSAGFGFSFYYYNQYPQLVSLEPNSPIGQAKNGEIKIETGDYIIAINGVSTKDVEANRRYSSTLGELFKSNTDPKEQDVFTILKKTGSDYDFSLNEGVYDFIIKAGWYEVETARGGLTDGVGMIKLSSFELNTAGKVRALLNSFKSQSVKDLIIDLRGNPGGFLDSVYEICKMFLPKGATIAIFSYKDGNKEYIKDDGNEQFKFDNIFVLTDGGSASASELLTGALVDNGLATQVGQKTYGKGSAQKTIRLGVDGGQLTYTYAVWTTVGREAIHKVGISPNADNIIPVAGLHEMNFPNYSAEPSAVDIIDILSLFNYLGYLTRPQALWNDAMNIQALNDFKLSQGLLADGIYDFATFIKICNMRINSRLVFNSLYIQKCKDILNGL